MAFQSKDPLLVCATTAVEGRPQDKPEQEEPPEAPLLVPRTRDPSTSLSTALRSITSLRMTSLRWGYSTHDPSARRLWGPLLRRASEGILLRSVQAPPLRGLSKRHTLA